MQSKCLEMTQELKDLILSNVYEKGNRFCISLGNYRLDFSKEYIFKGFTKKGVNLFWINGTDEIKVVGKVFYNKDYGSYKLVTEGWNYQLTLRRKEENTITNETTN